MSEPSGTDPTPWRRPTDEGAFPAPTAPAPTATPSTDSTPPTGFEPAEARRPAAAPLAFPPPVVVQPDGPKKSGWGRTVVVGVVAVAAMVGSGVVGGLIARSGDDAPIAEPPPQRPSDAPVSLAEAREPITAPLDVAAVVDVIAPSVVTISTDVASGGFGPEGRSVGTGVIITADGEILTNHHVVENATEIRVRLSGESEPREATLLASDRDNDLALLRIAGDGYRAATFAQPGSVRLGDEVVAIGFALDLDGAPSVTRGIVSALDRTIDTGGPPAERVYLDSLIQTDAAISSGNSGGPLVNGAGEVVGINTAVARGDFQTAASNIGFAISVDETLRVLEWLRSAAVGENREHGFLGVELNDRVDGGQGAIVMVVTPGSPADEADLRVGDVVLGVDGAPIAGVTGLVAAIRDRNPGDEVEIVVLRDGERRTLTAELISRPETDS